MDMTPQLKWYKPQQPSDPLQPQPNAMGTSPVQIKRPQPQQPGPPHQAVGAVVEVVERTPLRESAFSPLQQLPQRPQRLPQQRAYVFKALQAQRPLLASASRTQPDPAIPPSSRFHPLLQTLLSPQIKLCHPSPQMWLNLLTKLCHPLPQMLLNPLTKLCHPSPQM
eukprot:Protomagalhaensia_wolfi_Nauph_80__4924@NODE_517_length_2393_cov_62_154206_g385_i0_p2_GENE_NODE_517_length_2393_cov_62_154206_g385_i0NODE_517_length_2393_cov_62_154206_g385_i0_p2_ORF_typecomplete_len166_score20_34zfNFX1/PF01422_17/46zfNFX1/PF01422_17/66zfNFX1/PF01422_17/25_NODE_517_length_2393_cov_62_154206_g385_i015832080